MEIYSPFAVIRSKAHHFSSNTNDEDKRHLNLFSVQFNTWWTWIIFKFRPKSRIRPSWFAEILINFESILTRRMNLSYFLNPLLRRQQAILKEHDVKMFDSNQGRKFRFWSLKITEICRKSSISIKLQPNYLQLHIQSFSLHFYFAQLRSFNVKNSRRMKIYWKRKRLIPDIRLIISVAQFSDERLDISIPRTWHSQNSVGQISIYFIRNGYSVQI